MTLLIDIACPDCGQKQSVQKSGLGRYYCSHCGRTFTQTDVVPE